MTQILDLFDLDPKRRIEEIIKVDQDRPDVVAGEIGEYHPTDSIKRYFRQVLERFDETPNKPHEGVGVWISGFFGAGKSSFAKILGYALEDRPLGKTSAAALFARQAGDPVLQALLAKVTSQVPAKAVIFDVSTDQSVTSADEKLTDIVYRILLRELGYAPDREIAELEIELEGHGRLAEFEAAFARAYPGQRWEEVKALAATARNRASRVLHEMEPATYPHADSWARTPAPVEVTANFVAERAYELMRRRGGGRALVFVIDEVGQYVARSTDKMLDLQGLVQALGRVGRNRAREWRGQVWLVATSQERLDEVVGNLDGRTVELARLRDRFAIEVDLSPSDIREVTSQRVLKKRAPATAELKRLFEEHKGRLAEATRLSGTLQPVPLAPDSFANLYPFLPYQIDLVIHAVSGLRTQTGASRHVGGANRTIIKLAQQVLVNDRVALGAAPVGRLVTLDALYDLMEGMVTSERRRDVDEIAERRGADSMEARVAKALALLQFAPQVPRTEQNLAAVLHPAVDAPPQREAVAAALKSLEEFGRARETEKGWELLSHVGKNWEVERRKIDPFPKDRRALLHAQAEPLFAELAGYRHLNLRTFHVAAVLDDVRLSRAGDVELRARLIFDAAALPAERDRARQESNAEAGQNALYWVVPVPDDVVRTLDELHRSGVMITRHEREHSPEQAALLSEEKSRQSGLRGRLSVLLRKMFSGGDQFFRGVHTPVAELGSELDEAVRGALRAAVPRLYPKFDLAAVPVRGGEGAKVLESESLAGLPQVFYEGAGGLELVRREDGAFKVDVHREPLREVLSFIQARQQFGEKPTGKQLEAHFTGFGYGWDAEAVMLLAATLLRAGEVEVYSGRRYTSFADTAVRDIFRRTQMFRAATFARRQGGPTLTHRAEAAEVFEALYGEQVPLEEGALAGALRRRLPGDANRAWQVLSVLRADRLPGADAAETLYRTLRGIAEEDSVEDTILAFHGQREAIRDGMARLKRLEDALAPANLRVLREARDAVERLWPQLEGVGEEDALASEVAALRESLETPDFFEHLPRVAQRADAVRSAYARVRGSLAARIDEAARRHLDELRNRPFWDAVPELDREAAVRPLERVREKPAGEGAPLSELASDLRALDVMHADAAARLIELYDALQRVDDAPAAKPVKRIRASRYAAQGLRTAEEVQAAVEALRADCLDAIEKGETVVLE